KLGKLFSRCLYLSNENLFGAGGFLKIATYLGWFQVWLSDRVAANGPALLPVVEVKKTSFCTWDCIRRPAHFARI
ncbi:hypothetical protein ACMFY5_25630, partial [Pseudomonas sihuiensis]